MVSVAVQTKVSLAGSDKFVLRQTGSPHVEQDGAELSSAAIEHCAPTDELSTRCNTIKLEPTWTREYFRDQQEADLSLKVILQFKRQVLSGRSGKMCLHVTVQSSHSGLSGIN